MIALSKNHFMVNPFGTCSQTQWIAGPWVVSRILRHSPIRVNHPNAPILLHHDVWKSTLAQLPWPCFRTRALLDAVLLNRGAIGRAEQVAARLGLGSRFHLAGLLRAHGLPPLYRLSGWITVLNWALNWERRGVPLAHSALREGMDPAAGYRLVRRVTSRPWSAVCAAGTRWLLSQFFRECGDGAKQKRRGKTPPLRYNSQPMRP
jgi:hypothetical protein